MTGPRCLDIDMGNTRTKWRFGAATGAVASPALPDAEERPARVRVCTVLHNEEEVARGVQQRFEVAAEFASVAASLGGVRCGYTDFKQLGVDRWLAVVAAWQRRQKRREPQQQEAASGAVVVSAGTALTVDFVDAAGQHLGGYIAPGLALLVEALGASTRIRSPQPAVRICAPSDDSLRGCRNEAADRASPWLAPPARDTQAAVEAGTRGMLLSFLDSAIAGYADRCGAAPQVFATGGDSALVQAGLAWPVEVVPHLVLDGLAVALP